MTYLSAENSIYSENGQQKEIIPNPEFRLFATANPTTYAQREKLSEVFLSRLKRYYQEELSPEELSEILFSLFEIPSSYSLIITRFHNTVYNQAKSRIIGTKEKDPYIYSLRDLIRLGKRIAPLFKRTYSQEEEFLTLLFKELYSVYLSRIRDSSEKNGLISLLDAHFGFRDKKLNLEEIILEMSQENNNLLTLLKVTQGSQFIPGKEAQISPTASQKVILNFIVKSLIQNEPVLLVGNPASGKTTLIRYLARAKQTNLYYVNLSSDSGLEDLLGGYYQDKEGNWQYRQGLLFKAIQEGSWLFIDEANLSSLSEYLNTLIDFGYISDEEGKIITAHPNFRLFLSINPPKIHSSRNLLSPALRTRFNEIWVEEIDKREELEAMIKDWMGQESSTNTYPLPVPERTQRQAEENYGKYAAGALEKIEHTEYDGRSNDSKDGGREKFGALAAGNIREQGDGAKKDSFTDKWAPEKPTVAAMGSTGKEDGGMGNKIDEYRIRGSQTNHGIEVNACFETGLAMSRDVKMYRQAALFNISDALLNQGLLRDWYGEEDFAKVRTLNIQFHKNGQRRLVYLITSNVSQEPFVAKYVYRPEAGSLPVPEQLQLMFKILKNTKPEKESLAIVPFPGDYWAAGYEPNDEDSDEGYIRNTMAQVRNYVYTESFLPGLERDELLENLLRESINSKHENGKGSVIAEISRWEARTLAQVWLRAAISKIKA